MELKKQFTFSGIVKKFHEEDTQPIEIYNANIYCYVNGTILIEIDSEVNQDINQKKFCESAPIYHFNDVASDELNMLQILQPDQFVNILLQPDQFETEIVQKPYEGDYEIEGETAD